ncbi:MAG: GntR family transcriptional regulator [Planctomycetes bacterium]|nr:GntR family transcriptional regulator [Planctomycetota bacterium]
MSGSVPRVRPVTRTSLADTAYEAILDAILSGRIPAGEEVSEVSLAADLGISRTPVAHAVQKLAAVGLIDRPAGKQPRVAKFDRDEVRELYEMRELLESEAAARAATRLNPEQLEALVAEADKLAAGSRTGSWAERAIDFDIRFHDILAAASGNSRLCEQVRQYRMLVRAFCRSTGRKENLSDALAEHQRILAALAARDPVAARAAMADHIAIRKRVVLAELYPTPETHS